MTSAATSYSSLGAAASLPGKMAPSISVVPDATRRGDTKERLKAAAQDYEAVFVSTMLSQMFSGRIRPRPCRSCTRWASRSSC